jgi:predicted RNA-binding protein with PUA-like domain
MSRSYWLLKSEPDTWSWEQQIARGEKGEPWSGVRNFQARNYLRAMKKGDRGFFYHSNIQRAVVGTVEIVREAYPDPTAEAGDWSVVDVVARDTLKTPVTLVMAKSDPQLATMVLVNNTRLSVQPVTAEEWQRICHLGGVKVR